VGGFGGCGGSAAAGAPKRRSGSGGVELTSSGRVFMGAGDSVEGCSGGSLEAASGGGYGPDYRCKG